jgi:glutamate--cysteine ligase
MRTQLSAVTFEDCVREAASAFTSTGEFFGLECEWAVRPAAEPTARVGYSTLARLASVTLPAGSRVSLEPGGQVEISTAPLRSAAATLEAARRDSAWLHLELTSIGLDWDDDAIDVTRSPSTVLPSDRYAAMGSFWDAGGPAGRWMMNNTSSVQVNVSNDPADPETRWKVLNTIGPLLVAMFANSGGTDASGARWESLRQGVWASMDPGRTAPVRMDLPGPEAWLDYALGADVFFIRTDDEGGGVAVPPGLPFGEWMRRGHELGTPTVADFRYHLTTLFPPVRPKGWLELRVIDSLPAAWRTAAFLVVAVATRPHVARRLLDELPPTAGLWRTAARRGLRDRRIDTASRRLMEIVLGHVDELQADPADVDALLEFVARFTARSSAPSALRDVALPIPLIAETFDEAETGQTIPRSLVLARRTVGAETVRASVEDVPPSMALLPRRLAI